MDFIGQKCPFCENIIEENEDIVICGRCKTPHHRDCWKANHGCTTYSCYGEMLTPRDFEEPEFYKPLSNTLTEDDLEISKADGSQFADFYGGNSDSKAVFQGVRLKTTSKESNNNSTLSELFPKKTEEEIKEELRAKLKEEIKAELKAEIKIKPATALICERCGASLPVDENRGKIVCPSCMTEYILNNENGQKILKEIHFDNPFFIRLVDASLCDIKDYIDLNQDQFTAYKKLVSIEKTSSQKSGYWVLRLRAYTEDFNKIFTDYNAYDEIIRCIKEHVRLYPFEEEEIYFIDDFFERNRHALNERIKELKKQCDASEKEIIKLNTEEHKLDEDIKNLYLLLDNSKAIRENTKKENPNTYLWHTLCIVGTIVFGLPVIPFIITLILIPLALICIIIQIASGVFIYILHQKKIELEDEYKTRAIQQASKLESIREENRKKFNKLREKCVKDYYEYKCISEIIGLNMSSIV